MHIFPAKKQQKKPGVKAWGLVICPGTVLVLQRVLLLAIPQPDGIADLGSHTSPLRVVVLDFRQKGAQYIAFGGGKSLLGSVFLVGK